METALTKESSPSNMPLGPSTQKDKRFTNFNLKNQIAVIRRRLCTMIDMSFYNIIYET